ncbi:hypothetical protein PoB_000280600 [Plakobranchus ocellatus]|uniref:Uncharacterized protein n=1 Tax=Plakobranchus ocellatus TaxID=259542 RepID=A0AAV3Y1P9_9GAST|nr:hypothetical protein PoB_000280600 [Plakobranchus ocellatus]
MVELEPAKEGSLQSSGRTHKPLCHRRPLFTQRAYNIYTPSLNPGSSSTNVGLLNSNGFFPAPAFPAPLPATHRWRCIREYRVWNPGRSRV